MMNRLTSLALVLAACTSTLSSQDPTKIEQDANTLVLPAGVHEIRGLVNETARFLGRNILLEQSELSEVLGSPKKS